MAPKGKADARQTRYVCPQCFTSHFRNDVLFVSGSPSGREDGRQAVRRRALSQDSAFLPGRRETESALLLNWRAMPETRRRWSDGVITAVRDLDGTWQTQRVCPCCHVPLPEKPCPVVFGWGEKGVESELARDLLRLAAETAPDRWRLRREEQPQLVQYHLLTDPAGEPLLGVPGLPAWEKEGLASNLVRRCCGAAAGAVVRLRAEMDADGEIDSQAALEALCGLQDICGYSGFELKLSVVFLVEGLGRPDAAELFQQKCANLAREIDYSFENSCFVAGVEEAPQGAVRAVDWLSGHLSRLRAEGWTAYG